MIQAGQKYWLKFIEADKVRTISVEIIDFDGTLVKVKRDENEVIIFSTRSAAFISLELIANPQ